MPVSEKRRFFYSLLNEAVVATAHQGGRLLLVTCSQFIKCSSILRRSVFFWSSRRPDSAISRHVLHSVCKKIQMDAQAEKKVDQRTGERLKYNDIQGVCHRPHRDGDILRDPSGEAHQDSCWDSLFHPLLHFFVRTAVYCAFRPRSMQDQFLHWLAPSSFLTHKTVTTSKHLSQRALWEQPYLWPPGTSPSLGTDPQSAHASSTLTVTQEIRTGCTADHHAPFLITQTEAIDSALAERRDMSTSHRPSAMSCVVLLFDFDKRRRGSSHFLQPDRAYC